MIRILRTILKIDSQLGKNASQTAMRTRLIRALVWICDICHREINRKQTLLRCNHSEHWVHLRCAHIRVDQYTDTWICHLHRGSRLPHATHISPYFPLASSRPFLHSPPTPPHPKHQHTSNSPTSPP